MRKHISVALRLPELARPLLAEAGVVLLGQVLATLGSLACVRYLTRALQPTVYGELALALTLASLVQQVLLGPVGNAALRFYAPARDAGRLPPVLKAVQKLGLRMILGIATAGALTAIALRVFRPQFHVYPVLFALALAMSVGVASMLDGLQNAARQRGVVAWHQALAQWARIGGAIGAISAWGATSASALFGYLSASVCVLLSQFAFFKYRLPRGTARYQPSTDEVQRELRQLWRYAWPFASWGLFTWAAMSSDRWSLQAFRSTSEVGMYQALYQLGYYPITIAAGLITQLISPIIYNIAGDASSEPNMRRVDRINNVLILSCLALTALYWTLTALFHRLLFRILLPPTYHAVSELLPWMAISGGLFATGQIATVRQMANRETGQLVSPKVATSLLWILLNILGARFFGIAGVVYAGAVASIAYLAWLLLLGRRPHKESTIYPHETQTPGDRNLTCVN